MPRSTDVGGAVLVAVAAALILPGLLAFVSPAAFYDTLAGFPPENEHFLRDLGAFQIGLGGFALVAWKQPAVRGAAFVVLALHFALHTVSHVIDVSNSDPEWQGPFALVFEAAATAILAWFAIRAPRQVAA